jgi:hypothetical protein
MYGLKIGILPYPLEQITRLSQGRIALLSQYWMDRESVPKDDSTRKDHEEKVNLDYAPILEIDSAITKDLVDRKRAVTLEAINSLRRVIIELSKEERKLGYALIADGYNGFAEANDTRSVNILNNLKNLHEYAKGSSGIGLKETLEYIESREKLGKIYLSDHKDIDLSGIGIPVPDSEFENPNNSQNIYGPVLLGIELTERSGEFLKS